MKTRILLCLAIIAVAFSGCSFFLGTPTAGSNADGPLVTRVPYSGDFTYEVDTGSTARDVYFVFSSSADKTGGDQTTIAALSVDGLRLPIPSAPKMPKEYGAGAKGLQKFADIGRRPPSSLGTSVAPDFSVRASTIPVPSYYTVGETAPLDYLSNYDTDAYTEISSVCRYVSASPVVLEDGTTRTLAIWVPDAQWGTITQPMVDALADRFLKDGLNNDIYDWLTNILGAEWGSDVGSAYIPFDGVVHILLTAIDSANNNDAGIVGYFSSLNSYKSSALVGTDYEGLSNEKIMFVIDTGFYSQTTNADGVDDGLWSIDDYWPREVVSTLAHEFQHMIHYYQKSFVAGAGTTADVWINEMCSQIAEDLLADKMGVLGPRGVDSSIGSSGSANNKDGRIPLYNQYSYYPLTVTNNFNLFDYSTSYAFGAWAARNYGGAEFLRRVVCSPYVDQEAVEKAAAAGGAVRSDLDSLIARWAVSVMGSDRTDMPSGYRFNDADWFSSTYSDTVYRLGSIDFHKYLPYDPYTATYGPTAGLSYVTASVANAAASSNVYFAATSGLAGKKSFAISLPEGVTMSVVVK